jgi:hypothetical protein
MNTKHFIADELAFEIINCLIPVFRGIINKELDYLLQIDDQRYTFDIDLQDDEGY